MVSTKLKCLKGSCVGDIKISSIATKAAPNSITRSLKLPSRHPLPSTHTPSPACTPSLPRRSLLLLPREIHSVTLRDLFVT